MSSDLLKAAMFGNLSDIDKALKLGAKIDHMDAVGRTPLVRAAKHQHWYICLELYLRGANVNHQSTLGESWGLSALSSRNVCALAACVAAQVDFKLAVPNEMFVPKKMLEIMRLSPLRAALRSGWPDLVVRVLERDEVHPEDDLKRVIRYEFGNPDKEQIHSMARARHGQIAAREALQISTSGCSKHPSDQI